MRIANTYLYTKVKHKHYITVSKMKFNNYSLRRQ